MTTRKIDELGRIVLPMTIRRQLNINTNDELSIYFDTKNDSVILELTEPQCTFCNAEDKLISFNQHKICRDCISNLTKQIIDFF